MFKNLNPQALGISSRPSDIIEPALSHGFKGFDLDLVEFAGQGQGLAHARRLIESARLKIGSFPLPVNWTDDDVTYRRDLERLKELAALAQQLGCTRTTTAIESASDQRPYHENFEFHRRRLAELGELLAPFGIRLAVGFRASRAGNQQKQFTFMQEAEPVVMLLRTIGSKNVGLDLDLWNWHVGGGTIEQLRSLGDRIVTVALADVADATTSETDEEQSRLLPGASGAVDATAILTMLAELRYDGPVTPKPGAKSLQGLGREKIVKEAASALDAVWKAAGLNPAGKLAPVVGK